MDALDEAIRNADRTFYGDKHGGSIVHWVVSFGRIEFDDDDEGPRHPTGFITDGVPDYIIRGLLLENVKSLDD